MNGWAGELPTPSEYVTVPAESLLAATRFLWSDAPPPIASQELTSARAGAGAPKQATQSARTAEVRTREAVPRCARRFQAPPSPRAKVGRVCAHRNTPFGE